MSDRGSSMKRTYTVSVRVIGTHDGEDYDFDAGTVTAKDRKSVRLMERLVAIGVAKRVGKKEQA